MPLPTKNITENRDQFIERCMKDRISRNEFPDIKQRLAVCTQQLQK